MMRELTHLSLFSGIGGLDLAAEWAGFKTVGQCEYADYPYAVLQKHWPDVPRWRDIRTLTAEDFYAKTRLHTVDIISGGFPCQPFSVAGKQRGTADDRYLWPEMCRIVRELHPTWICGENVPNIKKLALDKVLADLEGEGYETATLHIPACGVGAWHRRERIAIMGYRKGVARDARKAICTADTYADGKCSEGRGKEQVLRRGELPLPAGRACGADPLGSMWAAEPGVGRVADGVPHRMDRLRCLGNAVVPQQFYPIFKAIAEVAR